MTALDRLTRDSRQKEEPESSDGTAETTGFGCIGRIQAPTQMATAI